MLTRHVKIWREPMTAKAAYLMSYLGFRRATTLSHSRFSASACSTDLQVDRKFRRYGTRFLPRGVLRCQECEFLIIGSYRSLGSEK
jgi:hypothetical protein